jgi:aminotransferase
MRFRLRYCIISSMFSDTIQESVIKKLSIRIKNVSGINLGQGIPSFPTAPHIIEAARDALSDPAIGVYPNFLGIIKLREALTAMINSHHTTNLNPDKNILITVGAMEATAASIFSIVDAGDRVGVITPDYCNHLPQILLARGKIVEIPGIESAGWALNLEALEKEAKKGLKLVIVTNPNNPTGAVISKEDIGQMVGLAEKYGFWILSDETYSFLTYDQPHVSLFEYMNTYGKILVVRSFSKEYAMTGWRVGYVAGGDTIIKGVARIHDALTGCAPKISQRAALAAITGPQDIVAEYRTVLKKRRNLVCTLLDDVSEYASYEKPQGAYYVFPKIHSKKKSSELSNMILERAKVAVIPGYVFGDAGEGHLRISFAVDDNVLTSGLQALKTFFQTTRV